MIRVLVVSIILSVGATLALGQSASTEKPPEKPAIAPATTVAPSSGRSSQQNNTIRRDELTRKLECRKQELRQEHKQDDHSKRSDPAPKK